MVLAIWLLWFGKEATLATFIKQIVNPRQIFGQEPNNSGETEHQISIFHGWSENFRLYITGVFAKYIVIQKLVILIIFSHKMGKIRRVRTKRHIEAVKNNTSEDNSNTTEFLPNEVYIYGKLFLWAVTVDQWGYTPSISYWTNTQSNTRSKFEKSQWLPGYNITPCGKVAN